MDLPDVSMFAVDLRAGSVTIAGTPSTPASGCLVHRIALDGTLGASASLATHCIDAATYDEGAVFLVAGPTTLEVPEGVVALDAAERALLHLPLQGPPSAFAFPSGYMPLDIASTAAGIVALSNWGSEATVALLDADGVLLGTVGTVWEVIELGSGVDLITAVERVDSAEFHLAGIDPGTLAVRWAAPLAADVAGYSVSLRSNGDGVTVCGSRTAGNASAGFAQLRDLYTGGVLREHDAPMEVVTCFFGADGAAWAAGGGEHRRLSPNAASFEPLTANWRTYTSHLVVVDNDLLVTTSVDATADRVPPLEPGRVGGKPGSRSTLVARVPVSALLPDDGIGPANEANAFAADGTSWIATDDSRPWSIRVEPASGDVVTARVSSTGCDFERHTANGANVLRRSIDATTGSWLDCRAAAVGTETYLAVSPRITTAELVVDDEIVALEGQVLLVAVDEEARTVRRQVLAGRGVDLAADADSLVVLTGGYTSERQHLRRFGTGLVELSSVELAIDLVVTNGALPGQPRVFPLPAGDTLVLTSAMTRLNATFDDGSPAAVWGSPLGEAGLAFRTAPDGRLRWAMAMPIGGGENDAPRLKDGALIEEAGSVVHCGSTMGGQVIDVRTGNEKARFEALGQTGYCLELDVTDGDIRAQHQLSSTAEVTAVAHVAGETILMLDHGDSTLSMRTLRDSAELGPLIIGRTWPAATTLAAGSVGGGLLIGTSAYAHSDASAIVPGFELPGVAGYLEGAVIYLDPSRLAF
ncbi:MAG: hypothetical protein HYS27_22435 [Deltaproteobacteria bacterium]|nr:hypothetical protein [Deltaproteobacteria bacterium]